MVVAGGGAIFVVVVAAGGGGRAEVVVVAAGGGGTVWVVEGAASILDVAVLNVVDVGEGDDAVLSGEPGESGDDSGLATSLVGSSPRMDILRLSAMDCPRRVPRLVVFVSMTGASIRE